MVKAWEVGYPYFAVRTMDSKIRLAGSGTSPPGASQAWESINLDQPRTSSIASMSSCMVASVSLPMFEMRKVVPLILP